MDGTPDTHVCDGRLTVRVSLPSVSCGDEVVADVVAEPVTHLRVRPPLFQLRHDAEPQAYVDKMFVPDARKLALQAAL